MWDLDSQRKKAINKKPIEYLDKAMINRGVHPMGARFILSIMHSDEDLQHTVECFEDSLKELKREGIISEFAG